MRPVYLKLKSQELLPGQVPICGVLREVPVTDQKRRPGKLRRHKNVILMMVNGGKM
jgi:hypothetical protein